jgi:TRAP-type C4-dicarboxylate transport system permease small subunit
VTGANYIGVAVILGIVLLTTVDTGLRYVFRRPLLGVYEITEFGLAVVVFFGLSYTALSKGHIRIELFLSPLSRKAREVLSCITDSLGIAVWALIAWQGTKGAMYVVERQDESALLKIPAYPFWFLVPIGGILLCTVILLDVIATVRELRRADRP